MNEKNRFELTFAAQFGGVGKITIPHANPMLDADAVEEAMDRIIDLEIIRFTNGRPVGIERADLITVTRSLIDIS